MSWQCTVNSCPFARKAGAGDTAAIARGLSPFVPRSNQDGGMNPPLQETADHCTRLTTPPCLPTAEATQECGGPFLVMGFFGLSSLGRAKNPGGYRKKATEEIHRRLWQLRITENKVGAGNRGSSGGFPSAGFAVALAPTGIVGAGLVRAKGAPARPSPPTLSLTKNPRS